LTGFLRVDLNLENSGAIAISSSNVTLKGLTIDKAPQDEYGIHAIGAHNLKIYGSYFNVDTTGLIRRGSSDQKANIYIENSNNVEIGGSQPERRNVISWCAGACIEAVGSGGQHTNNLKIQGNFIGIGADAVSDQGLEGTGISLKEGVTNAVIGGDIDNGEGNSIMHNLRRGFAEADAGHAGAFLDFAASARSLGMGGAHAAVADDASAVYWNPAGLSQLDRKDLVAMYSALYENTGFGSFNYAQPTVDAGTFGIGLVNLRSTSFDRRSR
jgi:hypothetical protein